MQPAHRLQDMTQWRKVSHFPPMLLSLELSAIMQHRVPKFRLYLSLSSSSQGSFPRIPFRVITVGSGSSLLNLLWEWLSAKQPKDLYFLIQMTGELGFQDVDHSAAVGRK